MSDRSRTADIVVHAPKVIGSLEGYREPGAPAADEKHLFVGLRAREARAAERSPAPVRPRVPELFARPMSGMRDRFAQGRCEREPEIVRRTGAEGRPFLPRPQAVLRILASATDQKGRPAR